MLPDDWHYQTIDDLADVLTGFAFESDKYVEPSLSAVRLLRGDNITPGAARWEGAKHWSTPYDESLARYELEVGDIAIALDRPIISSGLKLSVLDEIDLPCLLVQRVARVRAKAGVSQNFLAHALRSQRFVNHLKGQKTETAVPHVSPNDIRAYLLATPPQPEQEQISRVLHTWDDAISTTERLLGNSRKQKQLLVENLVSGKQRFGSGQWSSASLKQIASIAVSSVNKKHEEGERKVRLCNYTDVYYNEHITGDIDFMHASAAENEIAKFSVRRGDVLLTKDSETPNDIAISACVSETIPNLVCGYHLAIIRPDASRLDSEFLHNFFSLRLVRAYFASQANGATRFGLPLGALENALIHFPSLDEQRRIAQTLLANTGEIVRLNRDLKALKTEKAALMRQLLTGKRRVRLPQPAEAVPA